ncbi:MAG: acetylxylan esterase [Planctomycetota bacterium]|nr:acetylxylan esterase [Planctomycetota bacterium]
MFKSLVTLAAVLCACPTFAGSPVWNVLDGPSKDVRLGTPRNLNDAYHPWKPTQKTVAAWNTEAQRIREQLLVACGLWPMPVKQPLKPVIHGKIDRDDYTVEKVYFASHPGHYVTGNLYRPKNIKGKIPAILSPHGHWSNGRFYDAGDNTAKAQIAQSGETFMSGGRFPLQARMVHLARLGCTVFHYDMVGYADSKSINHRTGYMDATAGLHLQNLLGLQTFNSIRALDFVQSLPEVDPHRIGVTGASGGGTQTFMLCAIDPRPTVAFPAVMVSTGMQGGCVCENSAYMRQGINNIAIAALFAPKPMALSGADDWTIDIETKGLPELRYVYGLFGKKDYVHAKCYPQFKHNYNQVSREMMYAWFATYLELDKQSFKERDFKPVPPADLSVFDKAHPIPADSKSPAALKAYLAETSRAAYSKLLPKTAADVENYQQVVGGAARVMLDGGVSRNELEVVRKSTSTIDGVVIIRGTLSRKASGEEIPYLRLTPDGTRAEDLSGCVVWIDGQGKRSLFDKNGTLQPFVKQLLAAKKSVVAADVFRTGELTKPDLAKVNTGYQGYTHGYNRTIIANRVRDILSVVASVEQKTQPVDLVGTHGAGAWVLLARGLVRQDVRRTIADVVGIHFGKLTSTSDENYLPGALKYGGLGGLAALAVPAQLSIAGLQGGAETEFEPLLKVAKAANGRIDFRISFTDQEVVATLLK